MSNNKEEETKIKVEELTADSEGWVFLVYLYEGGKKTEHTVSLTKDFFDRFGAGRAPEFLVGDSFVFLLEKETKESISKSFDLKDIIKHFPDFKEKIFLDK